MSYFTTPTTTENPYFYDYYDNYTRKSPTTWSDYFAIGITALAWLCGILIICALGIIFMALGVVAFLVWAVYQSLNPATDHVLHPPIDIFEVWSDRCRTGFKIIMWTSVSAVLAMLNLILLAAVTAAFLVMMWGQLMECLATGGMLSSNVAGDEKEWTMGAEGLVSTFNATIYDRQVRIDTLRIAQSMLLAGILGAFLMMPLSYKVFSYGAIFFTSESPPRINNNLEETTKTEQRTDPKKHLALVQSAIDRLVKEKKEAELQLARERAQQKQLEDLLQKYISLAKSDPREP
ncbi:hypothetical protein BG006_009255 [Podila minutissima]|uniref:Transmembrane protein n=1 Tax=Podila minutissima TaxID=64525 RepID=A0A9P5SII9_9FUNG|nr:hypothetical protein BG006_009255 [Podila minutissima]